jgi:hypothetical protein
LTSIRKCSREKILASGLKERENRPFPALPCVLASKWVT